MNQLSKYLASQQESQTHGVLMMQREEGGQSPKPAGSFVHWQDINSPNYRHRCVRTATAPEAQLGPSISECVNG